MATATYANIFVNANSTATSTSFNPFDQTKYSSWSVSSSVNNCTYDSSNGRVTVGESGNYLVLFTPIIDGNTTVNSPNVSTTIKVDGVEVYSVSYNMFSTYGRQERTCHKVLNISANSYIEIFVEETDAGAEDIYTVQGTSLHVQRLYDDFGTLELIGDNAVTAGAAEVFPFYTGSAPGSSSTLSSSFNGNMSLDEDKGAIKTGDGGPALFLTTQYLEGTLLNPLLTINYYKNASSQWSTLIRKSQDDDPTEGTTIALENYSADDLVRISVVGTSTSNHRTNASSSMSLMNLPSGSHYSFVHVNNASNTLSAMAYYNAFDSNNYASYTTVTSENGIIYDSSNGRFNVTRDGNYLMLVTGYTLVSADALLFPSFLEDGTLVAQANSNQDSSDDPGESTAMYVFSNVTSGSYLEYQVGGTSDFTVRAGTGVAVIEMYTDVVTPVGPPSFNQGSAGALIGDDFTLNTFAQDTLSVQYDRSGTAQVPFILGQPGPLRLRGRTLAQVIKPGDKKN